MCRYFPASQLSDEFHRNENRNENETVFAQRCIYTYNGTTAPNQYNQKSIISKPNVTPLCADPHPDLSR